MSNWRARRDLAEIWRYSYSQWGLQQADRYVAKLYEAFSKLVAKSLAWSRGSRGTEGNLQVSLRLPSDLPSLAA